MSGGSYNYLYVKDVEHLIGRDDSLQEMADRLAGLGYANDAAAETQDVLLQIRQFTNRVEQSIERLRIVWKAVEWWDSNDSTEEGLKEALELYRNPPEKPISGSG